MSIQTKGKTPSKAKKWLIPAALVHRAAVNLKNISNRTNQIRTIAETDREAVDAYDDFMTRIGL